MTMMVRWASTKLLSHLLSYKFPTGISVGFKESMYTVNENDGTERVCVFLNIPSSEAVTVELTSSDRSALAGEH